MRVLNESDVAGRLTLDVPWWYREGGAPDLAALPRRAFFEPFLRLVGRRLEGQGLAPPVLLAGPRRAGKTVLIRQAVARLIETGVPPRAIAYADLDAPALQGVPLDAIARHLRAGAGDSPGGPGYLFLDSLHRRPDAPRALAELARALPDLRLIGAVSAGPVPLHRQETAGCALFVLPPLTFCEYLRLTGAERDLIEPMFFGKAGGGKAGGRAAMYAVHDVKALNERFAHYINTGGFPESVLLRPACGDAGAVLRGDVLGALLHGDLAGLTGIASAAELTALFTLLARNTGGEVSIEAIAERAGIAKNTVRRYLDWLEAAFLIVRMGRVHPEGGRFQRMRTFKVHLASPCLYAALFGPVAADDPMFPRLAESAIVGQWLASPDLARLVYARLPEGTVDLIGLAADSGRPAWACALGGDESPDAVDALVRFARRNAPLRWTGATTRTLAALRTHDGIEVWHRPASQYGYEVGRRVAEEAGG